jgi:hypothetical protein
MFPRDFFSGLVSCKSSTKASEYWPWLFAGPEKLVSTLGIRFEGQGGGFGASSVEASRLEADGFWIEHGARGSVIIGASAESVYRRSDPVPTPFAIGMSYLLAVSGWVVVHGALLSVPETSDSVIVLGPSGAGKSTIAGAALSAKWFVYGDDLLALRWCDGQLLGFGLRDFLRLRRGSGAEIIPVRSASRLATVREVWLLERAAVRPLQSSFKPIDGRSHYIEVLNSLSFGFVWFDSGFLSETIEKIIGRHARMLSAGTDLVSDPVSAMERLKGFLV